MSDLYLHEINSKLTRSKKIDFDSLQCISLYAHNDTDNKIKGLKISDSDGLQISSKLNQITWSDQGLLGAYYQTTAIEIENTNKISILVEAYENINDINHVSVEILISNISEFFRLDDEYIISKKNDRSLQVSIPDFKAKYIKIKIYNNKGSAIRYSLSYIQ